MESIQANESSLPGKRELTSAIISSEKPTQPDKESRTKEARSTEQRNSTQVEPNDSLPTVDEFLPIFQEDLRGLRLAGLKFRIFPDLQPFGKLVIMFDDLGFKNGDFFVKSNGSDEKSNGNGKSNGSSPPS